MIDEVDYSKVERRVLAMMLPHQAGKTVLAQMRALERDAYRAMHVPVEQLGEDRGPLTGQELRAIMETPPDMSHVDRTASPTGRFDRAAIRRYTR